MLSELKRAANSEKASERQALPEGTKIITIPVVEMASNANDNQQVLSIEELSTPHFLFAERLQQYFTSNSLFPRNYNGQSS
jgi:hypothetical protein